ncbi:hypothetical protein E3O55_04140 [Cryobacterium sp. MDB1-18-2]|nr:hypothetical protein E3O55_04140 [Cryobacterium sp. MDB1-18-2]TFC37010.1 hypothetical protein E3O50_18510 [Cryobacterium sp. MDB1-18-1]
MSIMGSRSVTLQASASGIRSGVCVSSRKGLSVVVVVLPKLWRHRPPVVHTASWPESKGLYVATLHEGDYLTVASHERVASLLQEMTVRSSLSAVADISSTLISPSVAPEKLLRVPSTGDLSNLGALLRLGAKSIRIRPGSLKDVSESSPLFKAFAMQQLVHQIEQLASNVTRSYSEASEFSAVLRGRLDIAKLPRLQASGIAVLPVVYDELEAGTPTQRIVMSALELCAGASDPLTEMLRLSLGNVAEKAATLRRALSDIPSYTRKEAVQRLNRHRLGRSERLWKDAAHTAGIVLQEKDMYFAHSTESTESLELSFLTNHLWEDILETAMTQKWNDATIVRPGAVSADSVTVVAPWKSLKGGRDDSLPDYVVSSESSVWCGDAKYKVLRGPPDRSDQYQIYSYSHLVQLQASLTDATPVAVPSRVALLFPTNGDPSLDTYERQAAGKNSSDMTLLDIVKLPFPMPRDLEDSRCWMVYMNSVCSALPARS